MCKPQKPVILVFISHYIPGYKAGGPIRTVQNMVRFLGDDFDFRIVTRDRDLGDVKPYPKIRANEWQAIDGAKVFYMSPQRMRIKDFFNIFKSVDHDLVYFNSFFDPVFTIIPLFVRRYLGA